MHKHDTWMVIVAERVDCTGDEIRVYNPKGIHRTSDVEMTQRDIMSNGFQSVVIEHCAKDIIFERNNEQRTTNNIQETTMELTKVSLNKQCKALQKILEDNTVAPGNDLYPLLQAGLETLQEKYHGSQECTDMLENVKRSDALADYLNLDRKHIVIDPDEYVGEFMVNFTMKEFDNRVATPVEVITVESAMNETRSDGGTNEQTEFMVYIETCEYRIITGTEYCFRWL